ncbi:MAG: FCD domain-containing protein [Myxococcales bacterium]|nr:FCD domain-containing protein [Myxococcales bacterium]
MSRAGEKAWETIRNGILRGVFLPGERLKEEELAAQTGVSRTPVREALRRLIREGLVEHAPNVGTRVIRWTEKELEDVFELRALLEGHAAERAAEMMSDETLQKLRVLTSEMELLASQGLKPESQDGIAQRNRMFHRLILEVGGGPRLGDLLSTIVSVPVLLRTFRRYSEHELRRSMQHHREILEAIEAGDGVWARAVMQAHLRAALHVVRSSRAEGDVAPLRSEVKLSSTPAMPKDAKRALVASLSKVEAKASVEVSSADPQVQEAYGTSATEEDSTTAGEVLEGLSTKLKAAQQRVVSQVLSSEVGPTIEPEPVSESLASEEDSSESAQMSEDDQSEMLSSQVNLVDPVDVSPKSATEVASDTPMKVSPESSSTATSPSEATVVGSSASSPVGIASVGSVQGSGRRVRKVETQGDSSEV